MSYWKNAANFSELEGETLVEINGLTEGSEEVFFVTESGKEYKMYHSFDCCESVSINEIIGNVQDLLNTPIKQAREDTNSNDVADKPSEYSESWTWTFYTLATINGYVTIRWLGESNGYYSEGVDFKLITK